MLDLHKFTPFQREIFVATFGAYFAAKVHAHIEVGRGVPTAESYDLYTEEAELVALEAALWARGP